MAYQVYVTFNQDCDETFGPYISPKVYLNSLLIQNFGAKPVYFISDGTGLLNLPDCRYRNRDIEAIFSQVFGDFYSRQPWQSLLQDIAKSFYYQNFLDYLWFYQPDKAEKDSDLMAIYTSLDKYNQESKDGKGIRTVGKPAKMFRRMFPFVDELACNQFAELWKETFLGLSLSVKSGVGRESFKKAYQGELSKELNPSCGWQNGLNVKSLSSSCMRPENFESGDHPGEVYGSKDFKAFWVEDEKGRVAARVVVCVNNASGPCFIPGPVYSVSNNAVELIRVELIKEGWKGESYGESDWKGAKILAIEYDSDSWLMPYVDLDSRLELLDCGELFVFNPRGDYTASSTSGYIAKEDENKITCNQRGERFDPASESYVYLESEGGYYCESCADIHLFYCSHLGEYVPNGETSEVYYLGRGWSNTVRRYQETVSDSYLQSGNGDFVYSGSDSNWWKAEDVTFCESESDYIPNDNIGEGDDYILSSESGELFPKDDMIQLPNGNWVNKETELDKEVWGFNEFGALELKNP